MKYISKDITTVESGIIIHGTNTKAVMGSGVALAIRWKWPHVYTSYAQFCANNKESELLGLVHFVEVADDPTRLVIANIFSQNNYGRDGRVYANASAISKGLETTFQFADAHQLPVYSVKIGAGLGGLNWTNDVAPLFSQLCVKYPHIDVTICEQ